MIEDFGEVIHICGGGCSDDADDLTVRREVYISVRCRGLFDLARCSVSEAVFVSEFCGIKNAQKKDSLCARDKLRH